MFDFVNEKKRLVQIILVLILLPFAFWGMESYQSSGGDEALAKVNGEKISQQEFDNAMRQQQDRLRESLEGGFDPAMLDKPEIKNSVLEGLVNQRLLVTQARSAGLVISDDQLREVIASIEAFQKDGKFDKQRYEAALSAQNMTPPMFETRLRQDLSLRELADAYTRNGYAANTVADNLIRLNEQQRVISVAQIAFAPFLKQAAVDESAVKNFYDKNQKEFQTAEQVRVEYVVLSADAIGAQAAVDDAEVRKYYDDHQSEFGTQEQRQAAHILVAVSAKASDADKQAARNKAEQVLQQVKHSPGKFAELARQYSQDPGSAANGGDLGMFGRGLMAKAFDDAVFQLKPGETSGLVQTEFGFHIIRLLAVKPAKTQALDEVKSVLAEKLKLQKANDKFAELAEKFSNTVYEQSDTLKPAAELVKSPVRQSGWLGREQAGDMPWTAKTLQAVFAEDVIKNKRNSAAIEIAPNTMFAARVLEYKPASTRPLAEVSDAIRQKLQNQQALELASKQGQVVLGQLQKGEKTDVAWKPAQTILRGQHAELNNDLARQVFQVKADKLPAYIGASNGRDGYTLVRVEAVKEIGAIEEGKRARYAQQLRQLVAGELFQAYLTDARKQADISVKAFAADEKK